ncbi:MULTISPECIES: hypothetical protein [unclassified Nonomuraea]|uniref:hypothetical protein n=1 Tax=unclassified Nonomuraea TaxID=2593643 RepID=UPI003408AFE4
MPSPVDAVVAAVSAEIEDLLAVPVVRLEELDGHPWVLRAHLADGSPVIVKRLRPGGYGLRSAAELMRCERAALELLDKDLGLAHLGPRLLAAEPDTQMLVIEDLAPRTELARLLRHNGLTPELDDRLTDFAAAEGEIAAASASRAADFATRRAELGSPAQELGDGEHAWTGLWRTAPERAAEFGVPMPDAAERDLRAAGAELAEPGPFLAFTNGDPEANNYLTMPDGDGRLIDFEGAGFRHALTAAAGFTVPGSLWMAVCGERQIAAFRTALARGVPEAEDDRRFGFGLASAAVVWTAIRSNGLRKREAREPGDDSRIQLVAGLEAGARTADAYGVFPHFAAWCRSTAEVLRRCWPDTDVDTAVIAPYTWRSRP